jgi:transposase
MGASRRAEREPGKSDEIDALAIARAVVKDGVQKFPVAFLDEQSMEIRLLSDHGTDLVTERTRLQNRLRWHLVQLAPTSKQHSNAARCLTHACSTASTGASNAKGHARGSPTAWSLRSAG